MIMRTELHWYSYCITWRLALLVVVVVVATCVLFAKGKTSILILSLFFACYS